MSARAGKNAQVARSVTTVVIGAGHAGLAMSRCLSERSIDHVVLEKGEVANSWRHERWDSLRLLTPNWQTRLPGVEYQGSDPDGYMTATEVASFIDDYAASSSAPVEVRTEVSAVRAMGDGYVVVTNRGVWRCSSIILASGAFNLPVVPAIRDGVPNFIENVTAHGYRNPDQLDKGGVLVVGASATGLQLADELARSGRRVTLAVGGHVRLPRLYRGRDIQWWMEAAGVLDVSYEEVDDITRARRVPSPQLVGTPERSNLDFNALTKRGVKLVGRLSGIRSGSAQFSGSLRNACQSADLKMNRLLDGIDEWAAATGEADDVPAPERFEPTRVEASPRLDLDLGSGEIQTIIWATGSRPDYSWLDLPVLDRKGLLRHNGGIVSDAPGIYAMGLPYLRKRKSTFIHGATDDARDLCTHLAGYLDSSHRSAATAASG